MKAIKPSTFSLQRKIVEGLVQRVKQKKAPQVFSFANERKRRSRCPITLSSMVWRNERSGNVFTYFREGMKKALVAVLS